MKTLAVIISVFIGVCMVVITIIGVFIDLVRLIQALFHNTSLRVHAGLLSNTSHNFFSTANNHLKK